MGEGGKEKENTSEDRQLNIIMNNFDRLKETNIIIRQ